MGRGSFSILFFSLSLSLSLSPSCTRRHDANRMKTERIDDGGWMAVERCLEWFLSHFSWCFLLLSSFFFFVSGLFYMAVEILWWGAHTWQWLYFLMGEFVGESLNGRSTFFFSKWLAWDFEEKLSWSMKEWWMEKKLFEMKRRDWRKNNRRKWYYLVVCCICNNLV